MKEFFTFTDNDYEKNSVENLISKLPQNVQNAYEEIVESIKSELAYSMAGCRSPIEQIMAMQLYYSYYQQIERLAVCGLEIVGFEPQSEFNFGPNQYFADFSIPVICHPIKENHIFIVECDGHEFHEKTKSQAQKDRARERAFINAGHTVLRFTGSEIVKNNCGHDVISIIINHFKNRRR